MPARYGVAIRESVSAEAAPLFNALQLRPTQPDVVAVWSRFDAVDREWRLESAIPAGLRYRGIDPVIYVEADRLPLTEIISGRLDTALRLLACRTQGSLVRWLQEPDGEGLASWQDERPDVYVAAWRHVAPIFRDAGASMFWCPSRPRRSAPWFPGVEFVDVVGWDDYVWADGEPFPRSWQGPMSRLHELAPGVPVWVGETGILRGLKDRPEFVRQAFAEPGIATVVFMDLHVDEGDWDHDWRWSPAMHRAVP